MKLDVPDIMDLSFQEKADPKVLEYLDKIGRGLVVLHKTLGAKKTDFPKKYAITGIVDVGDMPPVAIRNWEEIRPYFESLERRISQIATAISSMPATKVEMPDIKIPSIPTPIQDNSALLGALQDLKTAFQKTSSAEDITDGLHKVEQAVMQLVHRPQMTPPPVTHVSINAIQGFIKTTSATVGTTITPLPGYGVLANRRDVYIYNNSSATVYVGGSDVTVSNGIPVPTSSTSPIVPAGVNMILYGIAATPGNDVRVMEVSDESSGR